MLRISYLKVTRRYSHRCLRPRDKRQENRSWGPEDPQIIRELGQEPAGPAFETPGGTAFAILRSPGGNAERPLGCVWGTPAAFVQLLACCGMSLNPAAVNLL